VFIITRVVCFARFDVGTTEEGLGQGSVVGRDEWKPMDCSISVKGRPISVLRKGLLALLTTGAFSSKRTALSPKKKVYMVNPDESCIDSYYTIRFGIILITGTG